MEPSRNLLAILALLSPVRINNSHLQLLDKLKSELQFEYAVLFGDFEPVWLHLLWQMPVPVIQIDTPPKMNYNLGTIDTHNFLAIAFVDKSLNESLELIYLNMKFLNTVPVLLVLNQEKIRAYAILEWCWKQQLLNIIAIDLDFEETQIIHSYTPFPVFQLIERQLKNDTQILEQRLWDLNGYHLPIAVGGSSPRLIVYRDENRQLVYSGMVGNLLKSFEQRFNCKLVQPYPFDESAIKPAQELIGAVRNESVQFVLAATYPQFPFSGYTYPIELMSWCLMMPLPKEVPHSQLYSMVFDSSAFWLTIFGVLMISLTLSFALRLHGYRVHFTEYFLHNTCLRGILAQPFCEVLRAPALVNAIYLVICLLGILITAWYNSYFSMFVTTAPRLPPFTSYESIKSSNVKVVVWQPEYLKLISLSENIAKYSSIFQIEAEYKVFLQLRDSFDTRYGYMMPLEKWSLIKEQQQVFSSPLFTLREDLCFYHTIPIAFPIVDNSVFRDPLERLILDVTATGLLDRWHDIAFTEMIRAGQLSLVDRGQPKEFRAMKVEDLERVLLAGGLLLGLATLVFLMEMIWFWRKRICSRILRILRLRN